MKKYACQARRKDVTINTLHYSFVKNLVEVRTQLDQVAIPLGHESLDSSRICTQPSGVDLERAVPDDQAFGLAIRRRLLHLI